MSEKFVCPLRVTADSKGELPRREKSKVSVATSFIAKLESYYRMRPTWHEQLAAATLPSVGNQQARYGAFRSELERTTRGRGTK